MLIAQPMDWTGSGELWHGGVQVVGRLRLRLQIRIRSPVFGVAADRVTIAVRETLDTYGTGRNGTGRDGTGRDGTGGTGRDGTGRDGTRQVGEPLIELGMGQSRLGDSPSSETVRRLLDRDPPRLYPWLQLTKRSV